MKSSNHNKGLRGIAVLLFDPRRGLSLVILTVHNDGEQAVKQRLEVLVSAGDDFVEDLNTQREFSILLSFIEDILIPLESQPLGARRCIEMKHRTCLYVKLRHIYRIRI